ncbi:MAG: hypothetical protein CBB68_10425 [Rhodospirillaceae bacterium TMED8]|nr:hypothetical protein [Magnetovibrio sp.]OUT50261.1 MAG: hypothetical protein CBB68_10425 [Rhodospirillaceae bacterium TMED8]
METLFARYIHCLEKWVVWVSRYSAVVITVVILATIAAGWHFTSEITINTDTSDMLAEDVPFRQFSSEIDSAFPKQQGTLIVVIDGKTAGLADDATLRLGERLRARSDVIADVYDLRGEPFFRRHGFLYLDIVELYSLADDLAEAQPFLGVLSRQPNLAGFFHAIGLAIDEVEKTDNTIPIILSELFLEVSEVALAQAEGRFHIFPWAKFMGGNTGKAATKSDRRRFLIIKPKLDFSSLEPAVDAMGIIRAEAEFLNINLDNGLKLRLTGSAALEQEELASVEKGMGLAAFLSLTLVLGILVFGLRSVKMIFAILAALIIGLVWTSFVAVMSVGSLNLISVAFAVLFIGLSVDFGIHYGLRYKEVCLRGNNNTEALIIAMRGVGEALTMCALSAAISFFAFLPTDYVGLAELGVIAGSGMFIALFVNFTVLPALLSIMSTQGQIFSTPPILGECVNQKSFLSSRGLAQIICLGASVLTLGAVFLAPNSVFDFDPLNLKDSGTESVSTLQDLMEGGDQNYYSAEFLTPNIGTANEIAEKLRGLAEVEKVVTLQSFVPKNQEEKFQVINDMALFLGTSLGVPSEKTNLDAYDRRFAWQKLDDKLSRLITGDPMVTSQFTHEVNRMRNAMAHMMSGTAETMYLFEKRLITGLDGRLKALKNALNPDPIDLAALPLSLRERWIAKDGRALVEVVPAKNLQQHENLIEFVSAVRGLAPRISGAPVTVMEAGRTVLDAFVEAGVIAVIGICFILTIVLRRVRDVFLVFVPVVLAGLWTVAASVIAGLAFNLANVIVLPLLFGLGVAGSIHLVARARTDGAAVMKTSTPRAVILSAFTTIGSFGSISLSSHPGTASMGLLLTVAISFTMVATLVFLPALMRLLSPR